MWILEQAKIEFVAAQPGASNLRAVAV
jgi:hypothetical protein